MNPDPFEFPPDGRKWNSQEEWAEAYWCKVREENILKAYGRQTPEQEAMSEFIGRLEGAAAGLDFNPYSWVSMAFPYQFHYLATLKSVYGSRLYFFAEGIGL